MGLFKKKKKRFEIHDPEIDCPRCHVPMIKKTRMGVTIDKCKKCDGIWLDGGEIEKILKKIQEEQRKFRERQKKSKKKATKRKK
ncbi:zf-TFIIB domain-containing protein [Candidatus Woesearchaeota archaeon]|nr:zf-TFIIB domain-containing protein [Candidatus Woesearchaeota archaeon]